MKICTRLARKNREQSEASWEAVYEAAIVRKIRERYTVNQELAVLRQRDTKPEEFTAYNAFVEDCKVKAKAELGIN